MYCDFGLDDCLISMTVNKMIKMLQKSAQQCIRNHYHSLSQFPFRVFAVYTFIQISFAVFL